MQVNLSFVSMRKTVGIIPARWSSTRFPGKPLHLIAGKPLLCHVLERCQHARELDALIVATDDMRVAKAAFEWGAEVALTSPRHRSGTDRVAEVVRNAKNFEFVVNIQGDEPLIDPRLIDKLVEKLQSDRKIEIVTAAHPFSNRTEAESPHQNKVVLDQDNCALYFSRSVIPYSPDRSRVRYLRHQGIYGFRRDALLRFVKWKPTPLERAESLEQLRALENGVKIHVLVTRHGSPGVDTPADANSVAASLREAPSRSREKKYHHVAPRATATGRRTN
jgi:3-deoxy-manno-octulosonate cytidylyltransferase (CMP-KDO synthetase)